MDYKEFQAILADLSMATNALEEAYMESEGEMTEHTENIREGIDKIKDLLTTEGVDYLGRWLTAKEDQKAALKKERDYISRQIASVDNVIDLIKSQVVTVMAATGVEKVKGIHGYSFSGYTSCRTNVDKEKLEEMFRERVNKALTGVLPEDVGVSLTASVKAVPEGAELPVYYEVTEAPAVRFVKPRATCKIELEG